ncbi:hypothetical protein DMUE_4299 [Dictyocoela muelleri]|nr:hypothetical protein DMUE_4299 [Dictyocoela muelleri]
MIFIQKYYRKWSVGTGIIPVNLKIANVTAIFKKRSTQEQENYRPIIANVTAIFKKHSRQEQENYRPIIASVTAIFKKHSRQEQENYRPIIASVTAIFKKRSRQEQENYRPIIANVTAIFKKRNREEPENHRPIIANVCGRQKRTDIIANVCGRQKRTDKKSITYHLAGNHLTKDIQHGFRSKLSWLTNLLDLFNRVIGIYDATKAVDLISILPFKKRF